MAIVLTCRSNAGESVPAPAASACAEEPYGGALTGPEPPVGSSSGMGYTKRLDENIVSSNLSTSPVMRAAVGLSGIRVSAALMSPRFRS